MKRIVGKLISFLQRLLGLSLWKITTRKHGLKSVTLSKFAVIMSIFNFTITMYLFFSIERTRAGRIFNMANFHKTYLFELGDHLLRATFLARFYIAYISVWLFFRQHKLLYQRFLDADQYLAEVRSIFNSKTKT